MEEIAIVYGNRYRSTNKDVELGLIASTKAFAKGNYKESLEIILNALNIVEPGIHKKLLSKMES
jgi:septation ring formation regulator EzrA